MSTGRRLTINKETYNMLGVRKDSEGEKLGERAMKGQGRAQSYSVPAETGGSGQVIYADTS